MIKRIKIPKNCPNCGTKINQRSNDVEIQVWNDAPGLRDYQRITTTHVIGCKKCKWSPGQ